MLWVFGFKVWWWLAVEVEGSQVEQMFFQDNGRDGGQTYGTITRDDQTTRHHAIHRQLKQK